MGEEASSDNADEKLEVTDREGVGTGVIKRRADIHRDGDWHRTRTVWVSVRGPGGQPWVLLQQRGLSKGTYPGLLDASSAGHIAPGDTDPWREIDEELGVRPNESEVVTLGTRRIVSRPTPEVTDREVQDLWLWHCRLTLRAFRPLWPEVEAVIAVPASGLTTLLRGGGEAIAGNARWSAHAARPGSEGGIRIRPDQFIPGLAPYVAHIADLLIRMAAGVRDVRYDPSVDPTELD